MSVTELKERHMAATQTVNDLREKLKQKRLQLLDTDGYFLLPFLIYCWFRSFKLLLFRDLIFHFYFLKKNLAVSGYARSQGKTPVIFGPTDLVCCRILQGHTGKVDTFFNLWILFQVLSVFALYFPYFVPKVVCICTFVAYPKKNTNKFMLYISQFF